MKANTKLILLIVVSLLPLLLFLFPLWVIDMEAPQFPEGLKMNIYINDIKGTDDHGLASINNLNHYIGMKKIIPEEVVELKILPSAIIFISLLGVITAFFKRKWALLTWLLLFTVFSIAGLYDFYLWQTDYGQNLDPNAILKMEGVTYQPPLFGSKQIMNFTVTSLPGIGGWILFISLLTGWGIHIFERMKADKK